MSFDHFLTRRREDLRSFHQNRPFWSAAAAGAAVLALLVWGLAGYFYQTGLPAWLMTILGLSLGALSLLAFSLLAVLLNAGARLLPGLFLALVFGAAGALWTAHAVGFRWPAWFFYTVLPVYLLVNILLAGSIRMLVQPNGRKVGYWAGLFLALGFNVAGLYWLLQAGQDPFPLPEQKGVATKLLPESGLAHPGAQGTYTFESFSYGSGSDRQRPEFGADVRFTTPTVDARRLLPDWKGAKKKWRERYWGFGVDRFPLNGRVWMPLGQGPFPLVLIVHGNHSMEDYSDGGYAYLGELLASRGFIAVSVDENFLNGTWSGDFRGKEMPARAWLLLQHLQQWRRWNQEEEHPLKGRADLNRVLLAGHSRGGEAVAIAAAFNRLPYYPDDARERFDFGFGIRGIVALAPTDKRYQRRIALKNISYLSLQGSYDSDEASFFGRRQYERITFSDSSYQLKAGVLIHRANHGQFNTSWGRFDSGGSGRWLLNVAPLLKPEEQRQLAQTYIGAFAELLFNERLEYLPLFKDARNAGSWLPQALVVNSFQDSRARALLSFEEDLDLSTGPKGIKLQARGFRVWREEELRFRDRDTQGNNALVLGWSYGDSLAVDTPAVYRIQLPEPVGLQPEAILLNLAAGNPDELKEEKKGKEAKKKAPKKPEEAPDFTLRLIDSAGQTAVLPFSSIRRLAPRLQVQFMKLRALNKPLGAPWEAALETVEIPLALFGPSGNGFDPAAIQAIELVFDRASRGVIIVDEVCIWR